jgi:hypothetical protein
MPFPIAKKEKNKSLFPYLFNIIISVVGGGGAT